MDELQRKTLAEVVGELREAEQQKSSAEGSCRNYITSLLQTREAVKFKPSPYWEKKIKSGKTDEFNEALLEESESVVFDRLSEDDPTDGDGCLVSIAWDKKDGDVIANVYVPKEKKNRDVHLGDIKNVSRVLQFIAAFA